MTHQKNFIGVGLFVVLAAASQVSADGDDLKLVTNGRAQATIVLGENPTAAAQLAAFELRYYLKKISGAKLPGRMSIAEAHICIDLAAPLDSSL